MSTTPRQVDAAVVGAGFAGLYMLHRLRTDGFTVVGFERGANVGGTWYWNRYPGARCDVESVDYSYSFDQALEQEWNWTERYATQPEILRYLNHVADRFDLRPLIRFNTVIKDAQWLEPQRRWRVRSDAGDAIEARFLILATGSLSDAKTPDIKGLADFGGRIVETARWPAEDISFAKQRVGVIGTGSSGIQAIPLIAQQAAQLTVFQRTPAYSVPARNAPLEPQWVAGLKRRYGEHRAQCRASLAGVIPHSTGKKAAGVDANEREQVYQQAWLRGGPGLQFTYIDIMVDQDINETAAEFMRGKIRQLVHDPETAASLCPREYPFGAKRLAVDTDYYATFNRANVRLVDLKKTPLQRIVPAGVETSDGVVPLDLLVLATGFDAITGSFLRIDIRNDAGGTLAEAWAAGPRTCLGLMSAGFPNLFFIAGPGSPSVLSNMVLSIEQHVEWIADCLSALRQQSSTRIEAEAGAQDDWVSRANGVAAATLYMSGNSWYLGANVAGKPRVFMPYCGGVRGYRKICDDVAARGYAGFKRS